jgi:hypothetical protein
MRHVTGNMDDEYEDYPEDYDLGYGQRAAHESYVEWREAYEVEHIGRYLYDHGYTYAGPCEECGSAKVRSKANRGIICSNYGGCENAPG